MRDWMAGFPKLKSESVSKGLWCFFKIENIIHKAIPLLDVMPVTQVSLQGYLNARTDLHTTNPIKL